VALIISHEVGCGLEERDKNIMSLKVRDRGNTRAARILILSTGTRQCCLAGPFLSGSSSGFGSSLSKISAPAPAQTVFPI
jgi:hypothetical protein